MEDKWKHWMAKCILMGHSDSNIIGRLAKEKYTKEQIQLEIDSARNSPYVIGASEVFNRELNKARDLDFELEKSASNQSWLLGVYEGLSLLDDSFGEIQRITAPPFKDFVSNYIAKNRPIIITGAMQDWRPCEKWNLTYFRETHGDEIVGIQDGRESDPLFEQNQKFHRREVRFADFLDRLEATESSNDFYMTAGNMGAHKGKLSQIFADADDIDIRGEYFGKPAEGSLWVGPKGTITPLHFDMINNFFCQIMGRKQVRMVPSWNLPWVYNDYHVYSDVDLLDVDLNKYPEFENCTVYDFVIEPGEILFIPVGWWHHLVSLDTSISLTRKKLNLPGKNSFGQGFEKASRNFGLRG